MKIKCILIDDEPFALNLLEDDLLSFDEIEILQKFHAPVDVVDYLKKHSVDLIFLDIQMPEQLGTQFVRDLEDPPLIIFTTAYHQYAVEGFELSAVDYLLKPISKERLTAAVRKVADIMTLRNKHLVEKDHIVVHVEYKKTKIFLHEISYIEGLKDYVKIYLIDRPTPMLTRSNLRGMEKLLPNGNFLRIHNSFIVNKNRIEHCTVAKLALPEVELPIGKKYVKNMEQFQTKGPASKDNSIR